MQRQPPPPPTTTTTTTSCKCCSCWSCHLFGPQQVALERRAWLCLAAKATAAATALERTPSNTKRQAGANESDYANSGKTTARCVDHHDQQEQHEALGATASAQASCLARQAKQQQQQQVAASQLPSPPPLLHRLGGQHTLQRSSIADAGAKRRRRKMRDIVTHVKYEPSSPDSTNEELSSELDNNYYHKLHRSHQTTQPNAADPLERLRSRGAIQVLPGNWRGGKRFDVDFDVDDEDEVRRRKLERKLTATRWQPPTDWRKYERRQLVSPTRWCRVATPTTGCCASTSSKHHQDKQQVDLEQLKRNQGERKDKQVAAANGSSKTKSFSEQQQQQQHLQTPIVRHSKESSRGLLRQLARLRRQEAPQYRIRRSPSAAKIEQLIEQLELATCEWSEDEHLLDRAARRDRLPAAMGATSGGEKNKRTNQATRRWPSSGLDLGRRSDVGAAELESVARSHSVQSLARAQDEMQLVDGKTLMREDSFEVEQDDDDDDDGGEEIDADEKQVRRRRRRRRRSNSRASTATTTTGSWRWRPAERYWDDLAVRRLSRSPSVGSLAGQVLMQQQHPASYLLCSSAYTPPLGVEFGEQRGNWPASPAAGVGSGCNRRPPTPSASSIRSSQWKSLERAPVARCSPAHGVDSTSRVSFGSRRQMMRDDDDYDDDAEHADEGKQTSKSSRLAEGGGGRISADSGFYAANSNAPSPVGAPLARPATVMRQDSLERRANFVETDLDEVRVADWCYLSPREPVVVQQFCQSTTTTTNTTSKRRLIEERQECRYEFNSLDDDDYNVKTDSTKKQQQQQQQQNQAIERRPQVFGKKSLASGDEFDEKSKSLQKKDEAKAEVERRVRSEKGIRFSIGEYKSLNRPNLKIL